MDIIDIPDQLAKAFKYAGRSWRGFILSRAISIFGIAIIFSILYDFFYVRIYNVLHPVYGPFYWITLTVLSILLPLIVSLIGAIRWLLQSRKFKGDKFGIAIVLPETRSIKVATLSTSDNLRALDEASKQFLDAVRDLINNDAEEWTSDFEFRILPPVIHVRNKNDAKKKFTSLNATLLVWGKLFEEDKLVMAFQLTGLDTDLSITGPVDVLAISRILKHYSLSQAGYILSKKENYSEAEKLLSLTLDAAKAIDPSGEPGGPTDHAKRDLEEVRNKMKTPS